MGVLLSLAAAPQPAGTSCYLSVLCIAPWCICGAVVPGPRGVALRVSLQEGFTFGKNPVGLQHTPVGNLALSCFHRGSGLLGR
ncbi:hypothetical protein E2C01_068843 [Portunus trituberculatus]|uniref:Uncharacterized protein n=1 Tax=Portunus trituberculatus TaxID=210409 RepID=A0A5B7I180_PORTR|nr:hypothetical protein [Portunus trituberculatus]